MPFLKDLQHLLLPDSSATQSGQERLGRFSLEFPPTLSKKAITLHYLGHRGLYQRKTTRRVDTASKTGIQGSLSRPRSGTAYSTASRAT
jgi:hypothetical protein